LDHPADGFFMPAHDDITFTSPGKEPQNIRPSQEAYQDTDHVACVVVLIPGYRKIGAFFLTAVALNPDF